MVRTIRLLRACNQACTFCTLRDSEPAPLPTVRVEEELAEGRRDGATILRFTGGEPTLDRRLSRFVRLARTLGYEHVEVETNATLASYDRVADALAEAGLTRAWVTVISSEPAESDRVSRDPGGLQRTFEGIEQLARRGVGIGLCLPVTPDTAPGLAAVVERVAARVDAVRLFVVTDPRRPVPYDTFEAGLAKAAARCRKHKVDHRFEAAYCPPPCAFSDRFVRSHTALFASLSVVAGGTDDRRVRVPGCDGCGLRERCPGFPSSYAAALPGALPSSPPGAATVDAVRGQLAGVLRSERNQLRAVQAPSSPGSGDEHDLRLNWACNQRCVFCWVDFGWTPPTRERVLQQVAELSAAGGRLLSLTGGEPTLVPWLVDVVRSAHEAGFERIELQTNGMNLADSDLAERLAEAGLTRALVSLHSHVPEECDAITGGAGHLSRTLAGIDRLAVTGVEIYLNHVVTRRNLASTPDFVDFVARRWGRRVVVVWSVAAPVNEATLRHEGAILPFDEVGPVLLRALERCVELDVAFGGQDGTCGVPPCVLGGDPRFVTVGFDRTHRDSEAFVFVEACKECSSLATCRGVQANYVERFGSRGIVPLSGPRPVPRLRREEGMADDT